MSLERGLTRLFPGVWRLVAPNPSPLTGPGTNTYLVGDESVVFIDPGPALPEHTQAITCSLREINATVQAIIPTHTHPDHDAGTAALAELTGAPVLRFPQFLKHGLQIDAGGIELTVLHTPGHVQAHLSLWQARQRLLFAGDLVAGEGTVLVIPPDGTMADYLRSLRAVRALQPTAILPGHGPVIHRPDELLGQYINHRLEREQQVLHCWQAGETTAAGIAGKIYADRPEVLPIATLQIQAHLNKLAQEGRL